MVEAFFPLLPEETAALEAVAVVPRLVELLEPEALDTTQDQMAAAQVMAEMPEQTPAAVAVEIAVVITTLVTAAQAS